MVRAIMSIAHAYAAQSATTPLAMHFGAGVLIGFGLSACSFNLVLAAFGKLLPEQWRPMAFGAGTAAGSFGQFLFPPIGNILIDTLGWQQALIVFAFTLLPILPISIVLEDGTELKVAADVKLDGVEAGKKVKVTTNDTNAVTAVEVVQ